MTINNKNISGNTFLYQNLECNQENFERLLKEIMALKTKRIEDMDRLIKKIEENNELKDLLISLHVQISKDLPAPLAICK